MNILFLNIFTRHIPIFQAPFPQNHSSSAGKSAVALCHRYSALTVFVRLCSWTVGINILYI